MRKLILAALFLIATPTAARADLGLGLFIGEPLGLDLKVDLSRRQALDMVFGVTSVRRGGRDVSYGHLTYMLTPFAAVGDSIIVPLRIGIGAAAFGVVEGDVGIGARVPFQIGFMFRSTPLEIYLEIAVKVSLLTYDGDGDGDDVDVVRDTDGGVGLRFYL
jgi:hypothetical protein